MNRHGLIAGATGTGKTKTLQMLAEGLSNASVPVLLMDIKGDLSGIAAKGGVNEKITEIGVALPAELCFEKPTLFIRGGNSNYILDGDILAIKEQFPKASIETIPNTGHWLHAENPALFYQLSLSYLN